MKNGSIFIKDIYGKIEINLWKMKKNEEKEMCI